MQAYTNVGDRKGGRHVEDFEGVKLHWFLLVNVLWLLLRFIAGFINELEMYNRNQTDCEFMNSGFYSIPIVINIGYF